MQNNALRQLFRKGQLSLRIVDMMQTTCETGCENPRPESAFRRARTAKYSIGIAKRSIKHAISWSVALTASKTGALSLYEPSDALKPSSLPRILLQLSFGIYESTP